MPDRRPTSLNEDPLLAQLAAAFEAENRTPPESTITAVRAAVAALPGLPESPRRKVKWRRHPWAVGGTTIGVLVLGTGTAFATGAPVPPAVRILATDIGLPVTPQSVVNVRNAVAALQGQLHTMPTNPGRAAAAARQLNTLYHQLDPAQRAQVGGTPPAILHQACRTLYPGSEQTTANGGASSTSHHGWSGCQPPTHPQGIGGRGSGSGAGAAQSGGAGTGSTPASTPTHPDGKDGAPGSTNDSGGGPNTTSPTGSSSGSGTTHSGTGGTAGSGPAGTSPPPADHSGAGSDSAPSDTPPQSTQEISSGPSISSWHDGSHADGAGQEGASGAVSVGSTQTSP